MSQKSRPVLLMCPPDYFGFQQPNSPIPAPNKFVETGRKVYWDNPYLFHKQAMRQWENLAVTLDKETSASIELIQPQEGFNTQVFTADPSLCLRRNNQTTALISRFSNDRRNIEIAGHKKMLKRLIPNISFVKAQHETEGTGDNVFDPFRKVFWSGYAADPVLDPQSGRSDKRAHKQLSQLFDIRVNSLCVQKPFFHIDTTLAPLSGGHILFYDGGLAPQDRTLFMQYAFDDHGLDKDEYLIPVHHDDAVKFACNIVNIGDTVIMPVCSDSLQNTIRSKGYRVITVDIDRFLYSGGGPHCMVNNISYSL